MPLTQSVSSCVGVRDASDGYSRQWNQVFEFIYSIFSNHTIHIHTRWATNPFADCANDLSHRDDFYSRRISHQRHCGTLIIYISAHNRYLHPKFDSKMFRVQILIFMQNEFGKMCVQPASKAATALRAFNFSFCNAKLWARFNSRPARSIRWMLNVSSSIAHSHAFSRCHIAWPPMDGGAAARLTLTPDPIKNERTNGTLSICHIVARAQINENLRRQYYHRRALWSAGAGTFRYIYRVEKSTKTERRKCQRFKENFTEHVAKQTDDQPNERTNERTSHKLHLCCGKIYVRQKRRGRRRRRQRWRWMGMVWVIMLFTSSSRKDTCEIYKIR